MTNTFTIQDLASRPVVTAFARNVQTPTAKLKRLFPDGPGVVGDTFEFDPTLDYQEPAITYRAPGAELVIGDRPGMEKGEAKLGWLGKKKLMTELMRYRKLALQSGRWDEYVRVAFGDIRNLVQGVDARLELDRGLILKNGDLTINGPSDGNAARWSYNIAYAVPASHRAQVTVSWSDPAADIVKDLQNFKQLYEDDNLGETFEEMWVPRAVWPYVLANNTLRAMMVVNGLGPSIIDAALLNSQLEARGLPRLSMMTEKRKESNGVMTEVMPADRVVAVPPVGQEPGRTIMGTPLPAFEMIDEGVMTEQQAPGIVAYSYLVPDSHQQFNCVEAIGMPVVTHPSRVLTPKVVF